MSMSIPNLCLSFRATLSSIDSSRSAAAEAATFGVAFGVASAGLGAVRPVARPGGTDADVAGAVGVWPNTLRPSAIRTVLEIMQKPGCTGGWGVVFIGEDPGVFDRIADK